MHCQKCWKKPLNKLITTIFLGLMIQANVPMAQAVSSIDPYNGEDLSIARCVSKGGFDFGLFIDSVSYNDSYQEGLIEPLKDVTSRNQCQTNDILNLTKQEDKVRKAIRDAFLTCNTQKIEQLKSAYNKILVETYYVRHIVDGGLVMSLPYDVSTRIGADASVANKNQLFDDMHKQYVKADFFSEDDFSDFYAMLEQKYKDRKESYLNCKTSSWQSVKEKWDEFKEYFVGGGLDKDLNGTNKSLGARFDSLAKEVEGIKTIELLKSELSVSEYFKSYGQININEFQSEQGAGRMSDFFAKSLPSSGSGTSQKEVMSSISGKSQAYEIDKMESDLGEEFQNLYLTFNDASVELILNNLDGRNVKEDGLIEIIQLSLPTLKNIKDKSKVANSRQCTNIK